MLKPNRINKKHLDKSLKEFQDPFSDNYRALDKKSFLSIEASNPKKQIRNIYVDEKNSVRANCVFYPGDIVEIAPCKIIKDTMYSDFISDIAFQINDNTFVIPFGLVQYYMTETDRRLPNVDYMFDPNVKQIVIRAIKKISKDDLLILTTN